MPCFNPSRIHPAAPRRHQGYVLFDALAALLLMATTLLGAGLALVQTLATSRAAALQTTAVDLAADLTESLRGTDARDRVLSDWGAEVARQLPASTVSAEESLGDPVPALDIAIGWRDHADTQPVMLHLPVVLPAMVAP